MCELTLLVIVAVVKTGSIAGGSPRWSAGRPRVGRPRVGPGLRPTARAPAARGRRPPAPTPGPRWRTQRAARAGRGADPSGTWTGWPPARPCYPATPTMDRHGCAVPRGDGTGRDGRGGRAAGRG